MSVPIEAGSALRPDLAKLVPGDALLVVPAGRLLTPTQGWRGLLRHFE
jgi:hypothetical protein